MSISIETILGGQNLTGVIQSVKSRVPAILPPAWSTPTRRITGNTGTYLKVEGTRQTAQIVQYGSPSKARSMKGVSEVAIKLIHSFEHINHKPDVLIKLKSPDTNVQDRGTWEIGRQSELFKDYFTNLRMSAIYSALCLGYIYVDIDGNLLYSSSGASLTIDFGVPAGNKNQVGGKVATKWSDVTALITKQLADIQDYAAELTGYPLTTALYGSSLPDWIAKNTAAAALIHGNNRFQEAFAVGQIPSGFGGIKNWIPGSGAFFVDKNGTARHWLATDGLVLLPDPSPEWWEIIEGSYFVPSTLNLAGDAMAAFNSLMEQFGMFSYATLESDPTGIKQLFGDTFLPTLKVPKAIFILDVDF